jgi:hypothetical protein
MTHESYIKTRAFLLIAWAVLALLISCSGSRNAINRRDWKELSTVLHNRFIDIGTASVDNDKIDTQLKAIGLETIQIADLLEIKNVYYSEYVEPRLDDSITSGIDRMIEKRVCGKIWMKLKGKSYPPVAAYVITNYDQTTYQGQLENTYADDSIHVPEFPESYLNKAILYTNNERITVGLDQKFYCLVKPRYYIGHSWNNKNLDYDSTESFEMPSQTAKAVVFAIIAEKGIEKRKYKVLWVFEHKQ